MTSNAKNEQKSKKQLELDRLKEFPEASYYPLHLHAGWSSGVLLSDLIEYYCNNFRLLDPFLKENLKPAAYELRVGFKYSVAGQSHDLNLDQELVIPKFEVAVIEILETINMPKFMIGRWNIRTKWAYKGLIWVGGPQVDPGYRGKLLCPIWNLSNADFRVRSGEAIAVMDFAFTTPVTTNSVLYKWRDRNRLVFEDYEADSLRSGLITHAVDAIREVREDGVAVQKRVDGFIAITYAALAVLITAVALFVTKPQELNYWWDPSIFWLCCGSIVISLLAWTRSRSRGKWTLGVEITVVAVGLLSLGLLSWKTHVDLADVKRRLADVEKPMHSMQEPGSSSSRSGNQPTDGKRTIQEPTQVK